jgi:hypothetical protein
MIALSNLTVLVLGEIFVALLVLSGVLGFFTLQRKGRIRKSAQHLAERVQEDKPLHMERLKKLLAECYGYGGSELDQALHTIIQAEMRLYQNIINGFLKDDEVVLQQLDVDVENLVLTYQALNVPAASGQPTEVAPSSGNDEEMLRLKDENERLADELKVTMDTMGRMLNEYSSMFAGGVGDTFNKDIASTQSADESADAAVTQVAIDGAVDPASDTVEDMLKDDDIEIPDYSSGESLDEDLKSAETPRSSLEDDADSSVDDEVSEIIDEVMGIADEMNQEEETPLSNSDNPSSDSESLVDDLEQVDIEIPEVDEVTLDEGEGESGSLEEEWAKLLEEDAASKTETKNDK